MAQLLALSLVISFAGVTSALFAQSDSSASNRSLVEPNGRSGGQSLADFTELIALIRATVPGEWDSEEDTIQSFTSGVWIDPNGKLHREPSRSKKKANAPTAKAKLPAHNAIHSVNEFSSVPMLQELGLDIEETLRWISIQQIEKLLDERKDNAATSVRLELLGGLTRLDYIARDHETNDWYLGGPAGGMVLDRKGNLISHSTGLPPILLEDLLCVAPLVLSTQEPLGCSIDPVPEALQKLSEQIKQREFLKRLSTQPAKATQMLSQTLGDQRASFFGLPSNSPTAMALLLADEHMKRLGLGLVDAPKGVVSYWQACERSGAVPGQSMVRWWFALPERVSVGIDDSGDVFSLQSSTVRVMSQKQFLDHAGDRQDAADKDPAADAFADSFTTEFPGIQKQYPIYGRLRHIFDLAVALQVIAEETPQKDERPLKIASDESQRPTVEFPIQWVPSIAAWRKTSGGQSAAVVSGGVMIDATKVELRRSTNSITIGRKAAASLR